MKYCHNCGLGIEDDISLCPLCKAKQHDFIRPDGTKVLGFVEVSASSIPLEKENEAPKEDLKQTEELKEEVSKEEIEPKNEEKIDNNFDFKAVNEPNKEPKKPKKKLIIALIVILAILILGGGGAGVAVAISSNSNNVNSDYEGDAGYNTTTKTSKKTTTKTTTKKPTITTTITTTTEEEKIWLFEYTPDKTDLYFVSTGTVEMYQYVLDDNTAGYVATLCYCGYWDMDDSNNITIQWTEWYYDYENDKNSYISINLVDTLHLTDNGVIFDSSNLSGSLFGEEFIQVTQSAYYSNN